MAKELLKFYHGAVAPESAPKGAIWFNTDAMLVNVSPKENPAAEEWEVYGASAAGLEAAIERIILLEGLVGGIDLTSLKSALEGQIAAAEAAAKSYADGLNGAMDKRVVALENRDVYVSADVTKAIENAEAAAKTYADGLNTAMDGRVDALEAAKHTHENKAELDLVKSGDVEKWDAATTAINDFLTGSDTDQVINKLGEIRDWMNGDGVNATELTEAIAAEAKLRADADTALDGRLDVLEAIDHNAYVAADEAVLNDAKKYADGLANNYDAAGTAAGLVSALENGQVKTNADNIKSIQDELNSLSGGAGSIASQITNEIARLDVTDSAVAGQYVSAVNEVDGKVVITRADLPVYETAGAAATALANAKAYANSLATNYDAAGSAANALTSATSYTDTKDTAMNTRVAALEAINHDAYKAADTALETTLKGYVDGKVDGKFDAAGAAAQALADAKADATTKANAAKDAAIADAAEKYQVKGNYEVAGTAAGLNAAMDERVVKLEAIDHDKLAADAAAAAVATVLDGAPEKFDTLKEVAEWIADSESAADAADLVTRVAALEGIDHEAYKAADESTLAAAKAYTDELTIATGAANGTIAVKGVDVAVKGLGAAAYQGIAEGITPDAVGLAAAADVAEFHESFASRLATAETDIDANSDRLDEIEEQLEVIKESAGVSKLTGEAAIANGVDEYVSVSVSSESGAVAMTSTVKVVSDVPAEALPVNYVSEAATGLATDKYVRDYVASQFAWVNF